jgi:hypothetical protein
MQWLDKQAMLHHESYKKAGNVRSFSWLAALSRTDAVNFKFGFAFLKYGLLFTIVFDRYTVSF